MRKYPCLLALRGFCGPETASAPHKRIADGQVNVLTCGPNDKMKLWITLIVCAGLAAGGYYGWTYWQKSKQASAEPERPTTANVELRDINFAVNAAGEIAPAEQVSVRPPRT